MTNVQNKKVIDTVIEPVKLANAVNTVIEAPTLVDTVYSIVKARYAFHMKIIELYSDGTFKHIGNTYDEPLPHLFNNLERRLMKGIKL